MVYGSFLFAKGRVRFVDGGYRIVADGWRTCMDFEKPLNYVKCRENVFWEHEIAQAIRPVKTHSTQPYAKQRQDRRLHRSLPLYQTNLSSYGQS